MPFSCPVGFYPGVYSYLQLCKDAGAFLSRVVPAFTCDLLNSHVPGRWEEGSGAIEAVVSSDGLNADMRCRTDDGALLSRKAVSVMGLFYSFRKTGPLSV